MAEEKKPPAENPLWEYVAALLAVLIVGGFILLLAYENLSVVNSVLMLAVGIVGALSILTYFFGFCLYIARMGQEFRVEGIIVMEWGLAMIFVVVCLGGVLRLLERLG